MIVAAWKNPMGDNTMSTQNPGTSEQDHGAVALTAGVIAVVLSAIFGLGAVLLAGFG